MAHQIRAVPAQRRTLPPAEKQFLKGQSGNPAGRPKDAVSLTRMTRKIVRKMRRVKIDGKFRKISTIDLLILKLNGMAATGKPGAAGVAGWLREQVTLPDEEVASAGILLVPAEVTPEEFMAEMQMQSVGKVEPGTEINIEHEEFVKAARGEASPLGEALLAFHKKYGAGPEE
jgi:hypothetical protein